PHTELFSIRPDGTGETRLSSQLSAAAQPAWAPDGSELAVIGETAVDTYFQILVLDPKTGAETRRLTNDLAGHHLHPAWSRDGRTVAYALVPQSDPAHDFQPWELAVVGADGSNPHVIVSDPDGRDLYAPSWTPDGRIVFGSAKRGTDSYLEVMNADGTDRHQLARYGSGVIPAVAPRLFTDAAPGTGAPSELIGPEGPPASPAAAPARPVDASGTPTASPPAGSAPAGAPGSDGGVAAKAAVGAAQPRAAVASSKGAGSGKAVAVVVAFVLAALSMMFVDYWRRSRRSDTSPDATRRTGGG
ncbi:MAG: TolB protein, partial [Acidimicrobiaceae bacterium]